MLELNVFLVAQREAMLEHSALGVEQEDGKHLVFDHAREQFADALK